MAKIVNAPQILQLTEDWSEIQYTNLHYYHPLKSEEVNKMLKAIGKGSFFVVRGFKLALFKTVIDGIETCVARLTPGILVQDFTVIDFIQKLKEDKRYIYVKLFDEEDDPSPGKIFKLGSLYYHGTIGDGIRRRATYSQLKSINIHTKNQTNFRTLYRITLNSNYGSSGETIDLDNIVVDDFRFPPIHIDPTDPEDPYYPNAENSIKVNPDDISDDTSQTDDGSTTTITDTTDELSDSVVNDSSSEDDIDYMDCISRSNSIMWSLVFNS